jgi:hypothetical protein
MSYQLTNSPAIKRLSDNAFIPPDLTNNDYKEYLKWLDGYELQGMKWVKTSEGNTPLPPDPEPTPEPLTPQQKLEAAGLTIEELKELLGL